MSTYSRWESHTLQASGDKSFRTSFYLFSNEPPPTFHCNKYVRKREQEYECELSARGNHISRKRREFFIYRYSFGTVYRLLYRMCVCVCRTWKWFIAKMENSLNVSLTRQREMTKTKWKTNKMRFSWLLLHTCTCMCVCVCVLSVQCTTPLEHALYVPETECDFSQHIFRSNLLLPWATISFSAYARHTNTFSSFVFNHSRPKFSSTPFEQLTLCSYYSKADLSVDRVLSCSAIRFN